LKRHGYLNRMRGSTRGSPPRVSNSEVLQSWIGAFLGIMTRAWDQGLFFMGAELALMIGSFGASAVLVHGAVRSPWRNRATSSAGMWSRPCSE